MSELPSVFAWTSMPIAPLECWSAASVLGWFAFPRVVVAGDRDVDDGAATLLLHLADGRLSGQVVRPRRRLSDLVQEERSAVYELEATDLSGQGPGKGLLMTEDPALHQAQSSPESDWAS